MIFVPLIAWTVLVWLSNFQLLPDSAQLLLKNEYFNVNVHLITVSYLMAFVYSVYYILLEPMAGLLISVVFFIMSYYANVFYQTFHSDANYYALYLHVFSWIMQFISHAVFEKRQPALVDNLSQALLLAPFFVWFEVLFALGYRPQLKARLHKKTIEAIKEMDKEKSQRKNKSN